MNNISEIHQLTLPFHEQQVSRWQVVNVASVPQRSLFRYPGGKTWLVPYIRQWLHTLPKCPSVFVEPFLGGGIISLTAAFEGLASHTIMVELDHFVAAVWHTVLDEDAEWLAQRIKHFELTPSSVDLILSTVSQETREKAFQTILRNRVNRGGILAAGAGRVKEGESGKGLKSRWYPETLARRIHNIYCLRNKFTFFEDDGLEFLRNMVHQEDAVFFIDPPYTASSKKAGSRLYTHYEVDHPELFRIASKLKGNFLMTYDDAKEVRELAISYDFDMKTVPMKNTHHTTIDELLIGRNLDWL